MRNIVAVSLVVLMVGSIALANEVYVSADGKDTNAGTAASPFQTINKAIGAMKSGYTCIIGPGVYRQDRVDFAPAGKDFDHPTTFRFVTSDKGRAVVTGVKDETPTMYFKPFIRLEGLWAGGKETAKGAIIAFGQEGVQFVNCTFWGSNYEMGAGSTSKNVLIRDCRLIHMGKGWLGHPIYLSGGPDPTEKQPNPQKSEDIRVIGCTFINGEGFAMHGWHMPRRISLIGNFTGGGCCGMVTQGPDHVVHHNVFWKPIGRIEPRTPDYNWCALLPNDVLRFDHNVCWSDHPIREGGKSRAEPVNNITMPGQGGTQMKLQAIQPKMLKECPWLRQTEEELDTAVAYISDYFKTNSPEQIARDTDEKLEKAFKVASVKYEPTAEDLASRPNAGPMMPERAWDEVPLVRKPAATSAPAKPASGK